MIQALINDVRANPIWPDLRQSKRPEIFIPSIHLHHSIDVDALTRQDVTEKFALNAQHGGWSSAQSDAALKLMAGLYDGRIDLSALRR